MLKHLVPYLAGTRDVGIRYSDTEPTTLSAYCDADHAADPETRRSVSGYVFTCAGGAISWMSKRQALVTLSTTEAEYVAMWSATRKRSG